MKFEKDVLKYVNQFQHDPYNVYAFLYRRGKLISVGRNQMTKTCRKAFYIGTKYNIEQYIKYPYPHAEFSAVEPVWRTGDLTGKESIAIIRLAKNGTYALAKPCKSCQDFLEAMGIKEIYYTDTSGWKKYG